jgi:hypothetical protein
VDVATDGPTGVWRATEFPYDAIVMDVMLPGLDGFETCRRIRAADCWAPVLMVTARHGWPTGCADSIPEQTTTSPSRSAAPSSRPGSGHSSVAVLPRVR